MSNRLRLLMTADAVGGVWQYSLDLCGALAARDVEICLATLGPPSTAKQREAAEAIPNITFVETGGDLDWTAATRDEVGRSAEWIARLARIHRADLVHLNSPALAASANFGAPVAVMSHSCVGTWWRALQSGPLPPDLAWRDRLHRLGLHRADLVFAPSRSFATATRDHHCLPREPHVVRNGRAAARLADTAMHDFAFTAGRLWDAGKNLALLDRAAGRLAIPFKAAGARVAPHGATIDLANIHCLGQLDDVGIGEQLAARPIFVSAARYEPFGLAVLEAAAAGCALVLADIPTFRELWEGVAVFVDPGDDAGFADAIDGLVGDAALRGARGDAARRHADRYSIDAMADATMAAYRMLLDHGPDERAVA